MNSLDRHFSCYDDAAKAQQMHRRVRVELEGDNLHLFGTGPARPFWLAVNPEALPWESFLRDATDRIQPFRVSIRFTAL